MGPLFSDRQRLHVEGNGGCELPAVWSWSSQCPLVSESHERSTHAGPPIDMVQDLSEDTDLDRWFTPALIPFY